MKKIYILKAIIASFFCGILITSCDVLDQEYYMGEEAKNAFDNAGNVRAAAIGMYDALQNNEFLGGRAQIYVDIRSMDTNIAPYFTGISTFDATDANTIVRDAWTGGYRTLFEVNLFLERIAAKPGIVPAEEEKQFIGEAKFIRGVVYFYLLNLWGQQYVKENANLGVPLVLRSYDGISAFSDEAKVPRSTVNEVYDQIIKDLTDASTLLPESYDDPYSNLCRANSNAANAFLSRVYLYLGEYDQAISAANKVSGYILAPNLKQDVFTFPPTSSEEIIFFVAMGTADNPNTNNALGQHYGANYRADITLSQDYISIFDKEKDKRFKDLIVLKNASYYCNKYAAGSKDWAPIIRYAEVLLNKAEALAKNEPSEINAEALTIVNEIRVRSGIEPKASSDFTSKESFVNFILEERRRELAFEGHGSFDLFRNQKGIPAGRGTATAAAIPYPNNMFAFPIPQADVSKEPGVLIQNPGY